MGKLLNFTLGWVSRTIQLLEYLWWVIGIYIWKFKSEFATRVVTGQSFSEMISV